MVFIITGFASEPIIYCCSSRHTHLHISDLLLSYAVAISELQDILRGEKIHKLPPGGFHDRLDAFAFALYTLQVCIIILIVTF